MAVRRTTATTTRAKSATAKKPARAAALKTKKASARKKTVARKRTTATRATLGSIAAQVTALAAQLEVLTAFVRGQGARSASTANGAEAEAPPVKLGAADKRAALASFEADLLQSVGELDRRGRHTGMVPIPDLRSAFLARGWTRGEFDERLLQAERDFIVDLKTANDPSRLTEPDLAIEERGRGHLQFVVVR